MSKITMEAKFILKAIAGYVRQDRAAGRCTDLPKSADGIRQVQALIQAAQYKCHHCKREVRLTDIQEGRFDPIMTTLDRTNNALGHSIANCVVSCLSCNRQRRDNY